MRLNKSNKRERLAELMATAPFVSQLGMVLTDVGEGWVESEIVVRPDFHHQQNGFVHAGVQATLADHSAGCAAATLAGTETAVLTVEFKINLLRPAIGERLTCRAEVLKAGRTISVVESSVWVWRGEEAKLVSKATVTIALIAQ